MTPMEEINHLVALSKELILSLDQYRHNVEAVPALIKELNNIEKAFIKLDLKMTEDELVFNLNRNFMIEANGCLNLMRETLMNLHKEVIIYGSHHGDTFSDSVWNMFNKTQVNHRFQNFAKQIHDFTEHLLTDFLPILNTIITESFEREKIIRPLHSLSVHDKEKIRTLLFTDNSIIKLYFPKQSLDETEAASSVDHKKGAEPSHRGRASLEHRLSEGGIPVQHLDVVNDWYHVKWLQALPHIWSYFPELTLGQIKYIYLTHSFFLFHADDPTFINDKSIEQCSKLQLYLEMTEEIPVLKQPDYEFIATSIRENKELTMKQLIELLNKRFQGKREFNFLMVREKLFALFSSLLFSSLPFLPFFLDLLILSFSSFSSL
jgi:hypothetical protein